MLIGFQNGGLSCSPSFFKPVFGVLLVALLLGVSPLAGSYQIEDNVILHAKRGEDYMSRRRYLEAVEEFKIALQLNAYSSMSAPLYNNLGYCYRVLEAYPFALASYQRAIAIQPGFELYYKNLILTYQSSDRLPEAVEALSQIVSLNPEDTEAWYLLGLAFEQLGNREGTVEAFSRFVELAPHSRLSPLAQKRL